jgi:tetratricopeptide (TPR) repeat protein
VKIRTKLQQENPDSGRARRDVGVSRYFLGRALLKLEQPQQAMESFGYFLRVSEQRVTASPQDQSAVRDLAAAHEAVGQAMALARDYSGARENYERFQSLIVPLSDSDPDNTHHREFVARSHERLAELARAEGDTAAAIRDYREALLIIETLVAADPDNFERKAQQARILAGLGGVLAQAQEREARRRLESARELYESLQAIQPHTAELREGLEDVLVHLSALEG